MNIQEELRINWKQPVVGFKGDEIYDIFEIWIREHGIQNIHFICSRVYNLGRVRGKREERARKKKTA